MTQTVSPPPNLESIKKLKFAPNTEFRIILTKRIEAFFETTESQKQDCPQMYLKTVFFILSLIAAYVSLIFLAKQWWQALSLSIVIGLLIVGIGFNIQHDGSHNSYSASPFVNKLMAITMDFIGFSSYYWKIGHTVLHHKYVNVTGYDQDLDFGILARKAPSQPWFQYHHWQHYYIWLLYGLYTIEWSLISDFRNLLTGKFYDLDYPRPKGINLIIFVVGKVVFLTFAFAIPLMFHSLWNVLWCYGVIEFTAGIVRGVICVLAHEVEEVTFPTPPAETDIVNSEWAIYQIENTVNFPSHNRLLAWFLGGLNFQIEHHLFPHICHINYPLIAPLVKETCQEFGVKYQTHKSIGDALLSHFRWLRCLGQKPVKL